jgi:hypothetical protein
VSAHLQLPLPFFSTCAAIAFSTVQESTKVVIKQAAALEHHLDRRYTLRLQYSTVPWLLQFLVPAWSCTCSQTHFIARASTPSLLLPILHSFLEIIFHTNFILSSGLISTWLGVALQWRSASFGLLNSWRGSRAPISASVPHDLMITIYDNDNSDNEEWQPHGKDGQVNVLAGCAFVTHETTRNLDSLGRKYDFL